MLDYAAGNHDSDLSPGQEFGDYRIIRQLGRGGMGVVYEGEHLRNGRRVALKLLQHGLDDAESRQRFLREGRMAAAVMHPCAVYVFGTCEVDGTPVIEMELVPGGTLDALVECSGPLPIADVLAYTYQLIDGLEAAAAAGVLHRDIKPSNCFLAEPGRVKIGDFGLSRPIEGTAQQRVTQTGAAILATPAFASPEQLLGEPLDVRSDIYSLGATIFLLLTGRTPYTGGNSAQQLAALLQGAPPPLRRLRPDLSASLEAVLLRCLARQAGNRFSTYAELRAALYEAIGKDVSPARPGRRIAAVFIDVTFVSITFGLVAEVVLAASDLLTFWIHAAGYMVLKALPEILSGRSLGKLVVGVRIVAANGRHPSLRECLARAATWLLVFECDGLAFGYDNESTTALAVALLFPLSLASTMRRHNGYASALDLLLKTRVIENRPPIAASRFARAASMPVSANAASASVGEYRIGPLAMTLHDGSQVFWARDEALGRAVWVHQALPGTPAIAPARRCVSRAARLRWLAGERAGDACWDAYGAPDGTSLLDIEHSVDWGTCAGWMAEIAAEVKEARESGERGMPYLKDLWVSNGQQLILLDFPHASAPESRRPLGLLLRDVAWRSLHGAQWSHARSWPPLSLSVQRFLRDLPTLDDPNLAIQRTKTLAERSPTVSRVRRARLALLAGAPVGFAGLMLFVGLAYDLVGYAKLTPSQRPIPGLLSYLFSTGSDGRVEIQEWHAEASSHYLRAKSETCNIAARERAACEAARNRGIVIAWLATTHKAALLNSAQRSMFLDLSDLSAAKRRRADRILTRLVDNPGWQLSTTDSSEAARIVRDEWYGRPPAMSAVEFGFRRMTEELFILAGILLVTATFSIAIALLFRRGPAHRAVGIVVGDIRGGPSSRLQRAIRVTVHFSPILISFTALLPFVGTGAQVWASSIVLVPGILGSALMLIAILGNPSRGPGDRIAGTVLIPE